MPHPQITRSPPPSQGDDRLRSTYSECMQALMAQLGARPVRDILDVGAATGLSSLALLKAFPDAHVTGEQSWEAPRGDGGGEWGETKGQGQAAAHACSAAPPTVLLDPPKHTTPQASTCRRTCWRSVRTCSASGRSSARRRGSRPSGSRCCTGWEKTPGCRRRALTWCQSCWCARLPPPLLLCCAVLLLLLRLNCSARFERLPSLANPFAAPRSQVCHELPAAASAAVFKEAYRLLRPGGCLAVMVRRALCVGWRGGRSA